MAVFPVEKIQIVIHNSIKDTFLQNLQKEGIVHISEIKEHTSKKHEDLTRLAGALQQLSGYKKRNSLSMFFSVKRSIDYDSFQRSTEMYDYTTVVERLEQVKKDREQAIARLRQCEGDRELLQPWIPLKADLKALKQFKYTSVFPVIVPSEDSLDDISKECAGIPHTAECINTHDNESYYLFFVQCEQSHALRALLIENECEIVDFKGYAGIPENLINALNQEIEQLHLEIEKKEKEEAELSREIAPLETVSDFLANVKNKNDIAYVLPKTMTTTNVIGWIQKRHLKRLHDLIETAGCAFVEIIEKNPDERPPIALQNPTMAKPYEMLIKLYSMPQQREYDPTPFLAVFFPIMFALCITDAMYGILLMLISLYLMNKVTGDKSLFRILLIGGFFTIFAGAMVGGWFGDLFVYIGFEPLIRFKNALTLFDPIKQPMVFIGLALGLGFIHMMIGIAIEIIDSIKIDEISQALFANLTWFIILPSIILYFTVFNASYHAKAVLELILWLCIIGVIVGSHPEGKPNPIDQLIWGITIWLLWYFGTSTAGQLLHFQYVIYIPKITLVALVPLLLIEVFRFNQMKQVLGKIAWGFYNLYGISNYLGVLLSYVRLMALGMVTGVIAIAINKIAWMITGIPVAGIILVIIILIPSHLFNLIINTLGGFIHTMRLQYIEFFGRFYSGGGKPFKPFAYETEYVHIEK
jgi:V/A-type H+-transporting ATPase subunit I